MIAAREQDRRPRPRRARARVPPARARRPGPALGACTATAPATCSTRSCARLPGPGRAEVGDEAIRVAILGRPNVGKSSLLNAILGEERVIVSEVPGTTRDAIDTVFARGDTTFVLVDTAGLRRKRRQRQGIEYYSELRALEAAERADVALVLVDASEGLVDQDLSVADVARKAQCSTLVVLSKWDVSTVGIEDVRPRLVARLRQRPPVVAVSAQTGRGVARLLDRIETAVREAHRARLDRRAEPLPRASCASARQPPARGGRRLNLLYGTQVQVAAAALPPLRQRPGPRDARLRLLGRERAARAVRPRGRARVDRLRPPLVNVVVVGCGAVGDARSRALLADRGHDVDARLPRPRAGAAIAETGRNPRHLRERRPVGRRRDAASTTRRSRTPTSSSSPCRATRSRRSSPRCRARRRCSSLTKGLDPATGRRLSTLVEGRPVAVLSGPNFAEEVADGPARRGRDRERGPRARRSGSRTRSTRSSSAST